MTANRTPLILGETGPLGEAALAMGGSGPEWLRPIREAALARFNELGVPTTRHEEWRFTSIAPLTRMPLRLAGGAARAPAITRDQAEALGIDVPAAAKLVFIDGRLVPEYSTLGALPKGVTVLPLAEALKTQRALIEPLVARFAEQEQDAFAALNTAFMTGESGVFIHIPRERTLEKPIVLLNIATAADQAVVTHPRNLVIADEASESSIVEEYVSAGDSAYFTNAVTEIVAGPSARLTHTLVERESRRAFNISTVRAHQHAGSDLRSHSILLGGALVRNNVHLTLEGENCESLLNGLFIPGADQHMDNHMRVVHGQPHCNSRQYYKGILDHNARGVFSGRIVVAEGAQKTDAIQRNSNLLLSDTAQIDTKPQLEIYADDVRCTHGATIGQLDPNAIFYLRSRGMSLEAARGLLIYAFAAESLGRIASEPIREALRPHVLAHLPQGAQVKEVL